MRSSDGQAATILAALLLACGGGGAGGGGSGSGVSADDNVLQITVDGALCGAATSQGYPNKPCVAVTVCQPGSSACQVVDDVLLDTGSYGLRVFRQALGALALPPLVSGAGGLAECAQFADGSSDWGPVVLADVVLGKETAAGVPVHLLDAGYATPPASCPQPEASPAVAGFNGVLGVGAFAQDCGTGCAAAADNGLYFSCGAAGCTGAATALADQVQNPVAFLPADGNGVVVELPAVGAAGADSATGRLLLGVGTRANNTLGGLTVFPLDPASGTFTTTVAGEVLASSFLDTGSDGLFFAAPAASQLPACSGDARWYCPASTVTLSAVNRAYGGTPATTVSFEVGNFTTLWSSGHEVLPGLAGTAFVGAGFDWGLPFFLGRDVVVGLEGRGSNLANSGPYVAY
jgi:hypothetical protein